MVRRAVLLIPPPKGEGGRARSARPGGVRATSPDPSILTISSTRPRCVLHLRISDAPSLAARTPPGSLATLPFRGPFGGGIGVAAPPPNHSIGLGITSEFP